MRALITGASSGIGRDFAIILSKMGYDLVLVARRKDRLEALKEELTTNIEIISMDISSTYNCMKLYNKVKDYKIDIVINNAGFGIFGNFIDTNLDKELDLIDLNIKTVHLLTKLFLKDFVERDSGYILNVASSAAFAPGPLMASYYASKAYVFRLTDAIIEELKKLNSNVYVGVLCPGPVDTEFNDVAKVKFKLNSLSSQYVANYAINKMFCKKHLIIPGFKIKMFYFLSHILPRTVLLKIIYYNQVSK